MELHAQLRRWIRLKGKPWEWCKGKLTHAPDVLPLQRAQDAESWGSYSQGTAGQGADWGLDDLQLVEDTVCALLLWPLRRRQDQPSYGGLHEELLEHGIQIAGCTSILQADKGRVLPANKG